MGTLATNSRTPRWRILLFVVLLLSSGFCGIGYEILYGRILGNVIGDQFVVSASVLLTFFIGIGFGSLYAHRLWPHLWLLEASIGAYGVVLALGSGLFESGLPLARSGTLGPMFVCAVLLLAPALMIGTTLPIFAGYLSRMTRRSVFSGAYAVYNFGAAAMVLLVECWLVRAAGILGATVWLAAINGATAILLIAVFSGVRKERPRPYADRKSRLPPPRIIALALAGIASAVFQLLMMKLAESFMGPFRESFALVLCVVLLGIASGSALTKVFQVGFPTIMIANLCGLLWVLGTFESFVVWYAEGYPAAAETYIGTVVHKLLTLAAIMGIPAVTFGATIPVLMTPRGDVATDSGRLLFVSSLANAIGFLLMTVMLHPQLDYGVILLVIAGLSAAAAIACRKKFDHRIPVAASVFVVSIVVHDSGWDESLLYVGHTSFVSAENLKEGRDALEYPEAFKGSRDVFAITRSHDEPHFFINGYVSMRLDEPWEKIVGAFAATFAPRSDRALVLGVGSGATCATVGMLFDHTDGVEINGVVLDNLFRMKDYNFDIESLPNIEIVHDDAIRFVRAEGEPYSLIVNTVTTPLYFSSAKLYSLEFLEAIKRRLPADGIYATWIDSRVGDRGLDILLNTLNSAFGHCAIGYIRSSYFLLLCSDEPIRAHQPGIVAANPELSDSLLRDHGIESAWLPYGLLRTRTDDLAGDRNAPLNTLDLPALEFEMSRLRVRGYDAFLNRLTAAMDLDDVRGALAPATPWDPVLLALHAHAMLGKSRFTHRWRQLCGAAVDGFEARFSAAREEHRKRVENPPGRPR